MFHQTLIQRRKKPFLQLLSCVPPGFVSPPVSRIIQKSYPPAAIPPFAPPQAQITHYETKMSDFSPLLQ